MPSVLRSTGQRMLELECLFALRVFTDESRTTLVDVGVVGRLDLEAVQNGHQGRQQGFADLRAREGVLLKDQCAEALLGEQGRSSGASGTGADDDHVPIGIVVILACLVAAAAHERPKLLPAGLGASAREGVGRTVGAARFASRARVP